MHVTRDGGKTWDKVTPPDLPDFTRISLIEASPHQNGAAYPGRQPVSARRPQAVHLQDDRLRQDAGRRSSAGIPDTDFPRTIREDPKRKGLLFVGTEQVLTDGAREVGVGNARDDLRPALAVVGRLVDVRLRVSRADLDQEGGAVLMRRGLDEADAREVRRESGGVTFCRLRG